MPLCTRPSSSIMWPTRAATPYRFWVSVLFKPYVPYHWVSDVFVEVFNSAGCGIPCIVDVRFGDAHVLKGMWDGDDCVLTLSLSVLHKSEPKSIKCSLQCLWIFVVGVLSSSCAPPLSWKEIYVETQFKTLCSCFLRVACKGFCIVSYPETAAVEIFHVRICVCARQAWG